MPKSYALGPAAITGDTGRFNEAERCLDVGDESPPADAAAQLLTMQLRRTTLLDGCMRHRRRCLGEPRGWAGTASRWCQPKLPSSPDVSRGIRDGRD
jgi:hypothetical protein